MNSFCFGSPWDILFDDATEVTVILLVGFWITCTVADVLRDSVSSLIVWDMGQYILGRFSWTDHILLSLWSVSDSLLCEVRRGLTVLSKRKRNLLHTCWDRWLVESHTGGLSLRASSLLPLILMSNMLFLHYRCKPSITFLDGWLLIKGILYLLVEVLSVGGEVWAFKRDVAVLVISHAFKAGFFLQYLFFCEKFLLVFLDVSHEKFTSEVPSEDFLYFCCGFML